MTILHIHDRVGSYGGGEVYVAHLREGLLARGLQVPVLYLVGDRAPHLAEPDHYYAPKPHGLWSGFRIKQWLGPLLDRVRPDVVHCHTLFSPAGMAWLCARVPTVFTLHSLHMLPRTYGPEPMTLLGLYDRLLRRVMRFALTRVAMWVAPSEAFAQEIRGEGYDRVVVVPHFTEKRPVGPSDSSDDRTILFVGRLSEEKGVEPLLETLTLLREDSWNAVIVGAGPCGAAMQARVTREGLASRVRFTGWLSGAELDRLYRAATVVVVPSIVKEAFGLAGIEALAFGKPVVGFDAGGVREWLIEGRTGFLVPQHDCRGLADRLRQVLNDPALAHRMGTEGRRLVDERFRLAPYVAQILSVYESVTARGKAAPGLARTYAYRN